MGDYNNTAIIFEKKTTSELFLKIYPELTHYRFVISFDELLQTAAPEAAHAFNEDARMTEFAKFLTPNQQKKSPLFYATISALREALIHTPDQVEFAFETLASVPKNYELKTILLQYITSPLNEDRSAIANHIIERAKSGAGISLSVENLLFVHDETPSFLFSEVASAFTHLETIGSSQLLPTWELPLPGSTNSHPFPGTAFLGTNTTLIPRLAEHAARISKRSQTPNPILIPFQGTEKERSLLKYQLDGHHVRYEDIVSSSSKPRPARTTAQDLIEKTRQDKTRPLKSRLALASILVQESVHCRPGEDSETFLSRLAAVNKITADDKFYLATLQSMPRAPEPPPVSAQVLIVPFGAYPAAARSSQLAYLQKDIHFQSTRLLLSPSELELLQNAGFQLSRPSARHDFLSRVINTFSNRAPGHRFLFTSCDPQELSEQIPRRYIAPKTIAPRNNEWRAPERQLPFLRSLSATQLETYAKCPAQYLFAHQLRLRRNDSVDRTYPLLFGSSVHLALENFFKKRTSPEMEISEEALMHEYDLALQELVPSLSKDHALYTILTANYRRLARKVPRLEAQLRSIATSSTPTAFEQDFTLNIEGLTVRGKIDRIDETATGETLVLDYKTGTVDFSPDHIHKGTAFQALLYLLAVEQLNSKPVKGILFYDLKKGEIRRGIIRDEQISKEAKKLITRGHVMNTTGYEALKQAGLQHLKSIAEKISTGNFTPQPGAFACSYCDYTTFCRKGLGYE